MVGSGTDAPRGRYGRLAASSNINLGQILPLIASDKCFAINYDIKV
jgi:hypothetical protein